MRFIRFLKNLWKDIEEKDNEGTVVGLLIGFGMFFALGGAVLTNEYPDIFIYYFLMYFGLILFSIPFLLFFYIVSRIFIRWLVEIWKETKEEEIR